jgi:hypothetical protein
MATHNPQLIDGVANGTISKGQLLKYASGGWVACSVAGEHADGIAFSDSSAGLAVSVQVGGLVKVLAGNANIADGASITTTSGGLGVTAVSGDYIRGKAHGAILAGAYGEALWYDGYVFDGT